MDIAKAIRTIAQQQAEASVPADIVLGKVVSVTPLAVQIDQKLTIDSDHLLLTGAVEERTTDADISISESGTITISWSTESASGGSGDASFASHSHGISGSKGYSAVATGTCTIQTHKGLQVGEKVLMIRQRGGQLYIILDRVVSA